MSSNCSYRWFSLIYSLRYISKISSCRHHRRRRRRRRRRSNIGTHSINFCSDKTKIYFVNALPRLSRQEKIELGSIL